MEVSGVHANTPPDFNIILNFYIRMSDECALRYAHVVAYFELGVSVYHEGAGLEAADGVACGAVVHFEVFAYLHFASERDHHVGDAVGGEGLAFHAVAGEAHHGTQAADDAYALVPGFSNRFVCQYSCVGHGLFLLCFED